MKCRPLSKKEDANCCISFSQNETRVVVENDQVIVLSKHEFI